MDSLIHKAEEEEKKSKDKQCTTCQLEIAKQLAFCCWTAFGKPTKENSCHTYDNWLKKSGRAHVEDLCKEADFWEDRFQPGYQTLESTLQDSSSLFMLDLDDSDFYLRTLPTTVKRYKAEIEGKVKAGVCLSSAAVLQTALGTLCFQHYMYKDAEEALRGGIEKKDRLRLLPRWKRGFRPWPDKDYSDQDTLSHALRLQGKFQEAVAVTKNIPGVEGDMKLRRGFWRRKIAFPDSEWLRRLKRQTHVLICFIAAGRVDEGWESCVIKTLQDARDDWWQGRDNRLGVVETTLSSINRLADALVEQNKVQKAVEVLRQSKLLHEKYFTKIKAKKSTSRSGNRNRRVRDTRVWMATRRYAGILALGTDKQVQESLAIQMDLLQDGTFEETDKEALALLTDRMMGFSRISRHREALELAAQVLVRKGLAADVHPVWLGAMTDLAGSLSLHSREALESPALMQREVLEIARVFSNEPDIQQQAISLLWSLSRPGSLDESIRKLRTLSRDCETQYPTQRRANSRLKYWLAFIHLHHGAVFEDLTYLEESGRLLNELGAGARESPDDEPDRSLDVARLKAAVQSKEIRRLCGHGFGMGDFERFDRAIQVHRSVLETATQMFESDHPVVEDCQMRLAIILSDVGVALDREEAITEARHVFQKMKNSPQADYWGYALALENDEEVSDDQMHSAFTKFRCWLVGDTTAVHPGDLALGVHLADLLLNRRGRHIQARKALTKTKKAFLSLRKGWALDPAHHPDVLRAMDVYATLKHHLPYREVAQARQLNWWAALVHQTKSQASILDRYKISLALALSSYEEYRPESVAIAESVLQVTIDRFGRLHQFTEYCYENLAYLLDKNGDREGAKSEYTEALHICHDMLGPRHPRTHRAGEKLLEVFKHDTNKREAEEEVRQVLQGIDYRRITEKTWTTKQLGNAGILFCSSVQYLGPTHFLTTSSRSTLEFMLEVGGVRSTRISGVLERLMSIRFIATGQSEA